MTHDDHQHRERRFARIRRVKRLLRFIPRRARLHKYPFIGRFASIARRRSYLWSFKTQHVRPALYLGSIVNFLPLLGIQWPVSLALAFVFRINFMVMAGLQLITNPFTATPTYLFTYKLGMTVIETTGFGRGIEVVEDPEQLFQPAESSGLDPVFSSPPSDAGAARGSPSWGTRINALIIGGVIVGVVVGGMLDAIWRFGVRQTERHRHKVHPPPAGSDSTEPPPASL